MVGRAMLSRDSKAAGRRSAAPPRPAVERNPPPVARGRSWDFLGTSIYPGLPISSPHDPLEADAERMADRVMRAPAPSGAAAGLPHAPMPVAPAAVHDAVRAPGRPLDVAARAFMEPRFGRDFGRVRVHTDARAAASAESINAAAYTIGNSIVFGPGQYDTHSAAGRHLLAHELAHVVQGVDHIARRPRDYSNRPGTPSERFIETLQRRPENTFEYSNDLTILEALAMPDLLKALDEINAKGYLDKAIDRFYGVGTWRWADERSPELWAAAFAVKWTHGNAGKGDIGQAQRAANAIAKLDAQDHKVLFDYVKAHYGSKADFEALMEGVQALAEEQSGYPVDFEATTKQDRDLASGAYGGATVGGMATATPPPITPGPFNPPLGQAIGHYIGIEAHNAIARVYDLAHPGDVTAYNTTWMSTLLRTSTRLGHKPQANKLTEEELGLKPDITNLSRSHLYEIKPINAEQQGRTEAEMYREFFVRAGVPMSLGPTTEDGTFGAFPAPAGIYVFQSRIPGVIVYRYRQGKQLVPELVPEKAGAREKRWRYVLQPWQKAAIASTTVGVGVGLIIVILLLPVGA